MSDAALNTDGTEDTASDTERRLREKIARLKQWLGVVLDQVDYTRHACRPVDMVGACLDHKVIEQARAVLEDRKPNV